MPLAGNWTQVIHPIAGHFTSTDWAIGAQLIFSIVTILVYGTRFLNLRFTKGSRFWNKNKKFLSWVRSDMTGKCPNYGICWVCFSIPQIRLVRTTLPAKCLLQILQTSEGAVVRGHSKVTAPQNTLSCPCPKTISHYGQSLLELNLFCNDATWLRQFTGERASVFSSRDTAVRPAAISAQHVILLNWKYNYVAACYSEHRAP
jgi:hypothetical protein